MQLDENIVKEHFILAKYTLFVNLHPLIFRFYTVILETLGKRNVRDPGAKPVKCSIRHSDTSHGIPDIPLPRDSGMTHNSLDTGRWVFPSPKGRG
jgi:hypothetical protein